MAQSVLGTRRKVAGLRIAAPFLPVRGPRRAGMAESTGDVDEPHTEPPSSDAGAGILCPCTVLEIPQDASVEQARAAAEEAVKNLPKGGAEWILNMKLAAFGAIVSAKLGEEKAWELYKQLRPKRHPFNLYVKDTPPGIPQRPPRADAPPGDDTQAQASASEGVPRPTSTSGAARGSSSASGAVEDEGTSQTPDKSYWWQVRLGPDRKRRWGWADDDVNGLLEEAFEAGDATATAEIEGWVYYYDLVHMMQTSGSPGTERAIRRVMCEGDANGDWWFGEVATRS